jgi:Flp pilus assembly protein TadG
VQKRHTGRNPAQAGSAVVEIAVMAPLLAALILGTSTVATIFNDSVRMAGAVHAAAVYGAQSQARALDADAILAVAAQELDVDPELLGGGQGQAPVTITAEPFCECPDGQPLACNARCGTNSPLLYLRVTAVKTVDTPLALLGLPTAIREEAVMRVR